VPLVGRTGASGARVEVESSSPRHEAPVAHVRPFMQQPPPKEDGQENQPVEHVYADLVVDVGSGVVVVEGVVGTTITAVDVVSDVEAEVVVEVVVVEVEGWTYAVDVPSKTPSHVSTSTTMRVGSLNLHPTPIQLNPGRQHPPFEEPGQLVYPLASSQLTLPEHVWPSGQHPTSPATPLGVLMHVLPVPQHTSGAPIDEQLLVPSGHLNCRFMRTSRMCMRARNSFRACGRRAEEAWHVSLPKPSVSDLRADSC
jgi:hypothetical protein